MTNIPNSYLFSFLPSINLKRNPWTAEEDEMLAEYNLGGRSKHLATLFLAATRVSAARSAATSAVDADRRPLISDRLKSCLGPPKDDRPRQGRSVSRSRSRSSSRSRSADVASRKRPRKVSPGSSRSSPSGG